MPNVIERYATKVPEITLTFWIVKIAATTLGETGGDTVTMTLNWGYLLGTALFVALLVALVVCQIVAKKFHPFLYWATIVASTTVGTTMADFADRSLGIGYTGGSSLLLICLLATLGLWYWSLGSISVETVNTPNASHAVVNPVPAISQGEMTRSRSASSASGCEKILLFSVAS